MENTYSSFKESFTKDIKKALGSGFKVESNVVEKMNVTYDALTARPVDSNIGATINISSFHNEVNDGASYESVVEKAVEALRNAFEDRPDFDIEAFKDYNAMKDKLAIEIVSRERNAKLLETVPHKDIEDMSIVYRFIISFDDTNGCGSILVNNTMLEGYDITAEQLHEDALANAPVIRPLIIEGMAEVLAKQMGAESAEELGFLIPPSEEKMFVASVRGNIHGAGCLAYQDFMEKASEKAGGSFFILPSSIHELLIIPDNGQFTVEALENMVREVNATAVSPEEQLTDNVYHYDSENKIFELGEKYIARQNASEEIA